MMSFLGFVHERIEAVDESKVIKAFQLIERHFQSGNADLVTAIGISFFEDLDLGMEPGNSSWAYGLLPTSLRVPYEHYYVTNQ
jgi:hypothetical protein